MTDKKTAPPGSGLLPNSHDTALRSLGDSLGGIKSALAPFSSIKSSLAATTPLKGAGGLATLRETATLKNVGLTPALEGSAAIKSLATMLESTALKNVGLATTLRETATLKNVGLTPALEGSAAIKSLATMLESTALKNVGLATTLEKSSALKGVGGLAANVLKEPAASSIKTYSNKQGPLLGVARHDPGPEDARVLVQRAVQRLEARLEQQQAELKAGLEAIAAAQRAPSDVASQVPEPSPSKLGGRTAEALIACLLREGHKLLPAHQRQLNASQMRVAATLIQMVGTEWPRISHEKLGERVGLKARQVQSIIQVLAGHRFLTIAKIDGRENSYNLSALVEVLARLVPEAP